MLLLALVAITPLHFHFDASEFTNAVYQTACLTDRIACTKPVYARFWNEKMKPTREDNDRTDEFARIFRQLEHDAGPVPPAPFLPNYAGYYPPLRLRVRLLAAALASKSAADFRRRAAAYAKPDQADRLARILEEVEQRLHPWWVSTGRAIVQPRVSGAARAMTRLGAPEMVRQVSGFLDVQESAPDIYMHLVPSPEFEGDRASANPNMNHFCLEVTKDFDAVGFGWIAVHEQTHSLYDLSPEEKKLALMRQFLDSPDPSAHSFYAFMNEAMATAIQLLLLERNGKKDDDPYRDPYIPRLAQAALPLVREALAHKTSLFDGFAGPYIAAGRKQLGADADTVRFRFSAAAVLGDDELKGAFLEQIPVKFSTDSEEDAKRFPLLPAIRVLSYEQAAAFAGQIGKMPDASGQRAFACIRRTAPERETLFLVGRDAAAIGDLAKKLAASKEPAAEGIVALL